jgi:hypothetical protein
MSDTHNEAPGRRARWEAASPVVLVLAALALAGPWWAPEPGARPPLLAAALVALLGALVLAWWARARAWRRLRTAVDRVAERELARARRGGPRLFSERPTGALSRKNTHARPHPQGW